jgi:hypothetical protein
MFKKHGDVYESKVVDREVAVNKATEWKQKSQQKRKSKKEGRKS